MRKIPSRFVILMLLLLPVIADATSRFDGKWETVLTCEPFKDARGFSWEFTSEVKDGKLHGLYGTEHLPASIRIEGPIAEDGSAQLIATVWTGDKVYVPGNDTPKGTEFTYRIKAEFKDEEGKGTRIEGRPCAYTFKKN
jgi:hypothetical protein